MSQQPVYVIEKKPKYSIVCGPSANGITATIEPATIQTGSTLGDPAQEWTGTVSSPDIIFRTNDQGYYFLEIKSSENEFQTDQQTRTEIWTDLFGNTDLPIQSSDSVNAFAGSLTIGEGFSDEEILEALDDE